ACAIQIYIREKINTIAVLRCLGTSALQSFLIYLIQIIAIGFVGSVIGALLGTFIQQFLPYVLKDLLPIQLTTMVSWTAIAQGIILGVIIAVLFALLSLVSIRKISPLNTLRISFQPNNMRRDPVRWLVYILIVSIWLGTALICTLFFIQNMLLNRVSLSASGNQPNMVVFDIQSTQRAGVIQLAKQEGLPVNGTVPVVTMRLEAINKITPAA